MDRASRQKMIIVKGRVVLGIERACISKKAEPFTSFLLNKYLLPFYDALPIHPN